MRIGLIARADFTGLGIQTWDFYKQMKPDKVLIIDLSHLNGQVNDFSRYPGAQVLQYTPYPDTRRHHPQAVAAFNEFLQDIDLVFTCETPYDYHLFTEARARGIKSVLQYNFELLDHVREPDLPQPDLFMAPSLWRFDEVALPNKVFVPVPVDREAFPFRQRTEAKTFVHVVGNMAMEDRNGTQQVLDAWQHVQSESRLIVWTQNGNFHSRDRRVEVRRTRVQNQAEFYEEADAFILPRKFGGLCLPLNEALSCGLPIITTDLQPQRAFVHNNGLVPSFWQKEVMTKMMVDIWQARPEDIASKVDELAAEPDIVKAMSWYSHCVADLIDWERMKPAYQRTFQQVLSGVTPAQEYYW